jgi:hypothetical protein
MAKTPQKEDVGDERSAEETERIREATLKKMLSSPPKPHKDMVGKMSPKDKPK